MASTPLGVVLPEHIARNLEREQAVDRQLALWGVYERLAKDIDPRLSLVWVKDDINPDLIFGDLVPGRWHFVRDNSDKGVPDSYMPVLAEGGGFREPVGSDIDRLREMDLWNPEVARKVKEGSERKRLAKEKETAERREGRREDGRTVLKALTSPGVSFSDTKWTNSKRGKRG